jgi:hypothetical protein
MRTLFVLAIVANSIDLFGTAVGIHGLGNREGNPLLAWVAHHHWLVFVAIKGALVPALIWRLYRYRQESPLLSTAGMGVVTVALTVAVGEWLGWITAVMRVRGVAGF